MLELLNICRALKHRQIDYELSIEQIKSNELALQIKQCISQICVVIYKTLTQRYAIEFVVIIDRQLNINSIIA